MMRVATRVVLLLFLCLIPRTATANLIVNGGFETGDFTGWTVTGTMQYFGVLPMAARSGVYGAWFGDIEGITSISQTVATVPGVTYELSFWVANPIGNVNYAELWWDGNLIDSVQNSEPFGWDQVSFLVTATTGSTEFKIGGNNPPGYWTLDDFSLVEAVPEPSSLGLGALGVTFLAVLAIGRRRS